MKLSVLICTRNRAQSLAATLERLLSQRRAGGYEVEVVVVDNDGGDETAQVLRRAEARHPGLLRSVREPRRGLSRARNRAIEASTGDLIVFTDDDVLVSENWLDEIHGEFARNPRIAALGGRVLLAREGLQRVSMLEDEARQEYVFPGDGGIGMGANMAFRRELFERIGGFDVRLGAGRFFAGADEVDVFYRALRAGCRLLYAPNVLVHHDHDRTTVEQASRLEFGYGKGCAAYLVKHAIAGDAHAMRRLYWLLLTLPRRWRRRDGESPDLLRRRRAQIKGILLGVLLAPWAMWPSPDARPLRAAARPRIEELPARSKI